MAAGLKTIISLSFVWTLPRLSLSASPAFTPHPRRRVETANPPAPQGPRRRRHPRHPVVSAMEQLPPAAGRGHVSGCVGAECGVRVLCESGRFHGEQRERAH